MRPASRRSESVEQRAAPRLAPAERRMLVVAALGADGGAAVARELVRWALDAGRHPAVVDIGNPEEPAALIDPPGVLPAGGPRVALAQLPTPPESLKDQPAEVLAALLERLRRHEAASDLLVVRVDPRFRRALMRAAFLAGGLVLPLAERPDTLHEALRLSRELLGSFLDVALWPVSSEPDAIDRFRALMLEFLGAETSPPELDPALAASFVETIPGPPDEGFLVSLIDPDTPSPPAQLMRLGTLTL
jgi:hypothetical protein